MNDELLATFDEEQIFRIDHYLGKEMIQSIFAIRFANLIFENVWNKDFIDNIQITFAERLGVEERGGYYDESGALRDMVQNHTLQTSFPPRYGQASKLHKKMRFVLRRLRSLKTSIIQLMKSLKNTLSVVNTVQVRLMA